MKEREPRLPAFRYRDFRLLWFGEMVSSVGSQMQLFAINWHIFSLLRDQTFVVILLGRQFELNSDALGLGMLGLVRVLPIVMFALIGGVLADALDRRTLMVWTRIVAAILAAILTVMTLSGNISVNTIFLLTALGTAAVAFDQPARQSIVPNLVNPEHLTNAVSLNTLMFQVGSITGPALAGILVAKFNIGIVYGINTLTFLVAIVAIILIRHRGKMQSSTGIGWAALVEGFRFTRGTRIIWGTMLLDFFATLFSSARTMLPIVAADILKVGVSGYGLLATAQPIGSLLVGFVLAFRRDIRRQGMVLLVSVGVYGFATALFGLSTNYTLSYILFALTGAGDTISTVVRGTIRQIMTPDHLRGRMVSINMMFFMGGPQLGELEAGLVAAALGAPFAIFTGGIATMLLTGWVAWRFPSILRYSNEKEMQAQKSAASP